MNFRLKKIKILSLCKVFPMTAHHCIFLLPSEFICNLPKTMPDVMTRNFKETNNRLYEGLLMLVILNSGDR